jgi:hypothetical protein
MMGKKEEEPAAAKDEAKSDEGGDAKADGGEGDAKAEGGEAEPAPVEPIPVEELHTGLDLMLKLVPADSNQYVIVRDATVLSDYAEEGTRFLDGPLAKLSTSKIAATSPELAMASTGLSAAQPQMEAIKAAVEASGVDLKQGVGLIKHKDDHDYLVFHASDPNAMKSLAQAIAKTKDGTPPKELFCKAIEGVDGFNVCADSQAEVDAYKPRDEPGELRTALEDKLTGIKIDDANIVGHIKDKEEVFLAVSTIPGTVHVAAVVEGGSSDIEEMKKAIKAGEAKTLGTVAPGAGFVWANVAPEAMAGAMKEMAGLPPDVEGFAKAFNGEVLLAGTIDPGGFVFSAGMTDTAAWTPVATMAIAMKDPLIEQANKELGALGGAKFVFEELPIAAASGEVKALHMGVTDLAEADVLKAYTGLHLDGWAFAANNGFTVAVGPDKDNVGKLMAASAGGPSEALLASLPLSLSEGFKANEVAAVVHLPVDWVQGKQMHELVKSAFKSVPDFNPDEAIAALSLLAPLSSGTFWIAMPEGKSPVFHVAVQGVGNRETEEGKAALEAAHTVADGGDPETAFAELATRFSASPMAYAYKARAGTDGPAYLVGSGVGALVAAGAMAAPVAMGVRNENLAADLGVKPEDPEPELKPTAVPERPKTEPKKAEPKKATPKKPADPKKDEPKKDDPKKDDPIVEPKRPLPPKPTEDPKADPKKDDPAVPKRTWGKGRPAK